MTILRKGGGGVSENPKFPYQKKLRFFWHKGGGGLTQSKMVLSEKMRFFGIFCQKGGFLSEKNPINWRLILKHRKPRKKSYPQKPHSFCSF